MALPLPERSSNSFLFDIVLETSSVGEGADFRGEGGEEGGGGDVVSGCCCCWTAPWAAGLCVARTLTLWILTLHTIWFLPVSRERGKNHARRPRDARGGEARSRSSLCPCAQFWLQLQTLPSSYRRHAKLSSCGPTFPFEKAVRRQFLQAGEATNSEARAGRGEELQALGRLREILREEGTRFLEEETRREKRELTSRGTLTLRLPEFLCGGNSAGACVKHGFFTFGSAAVAVSC